MGINPYENIFSSPFQCHALIFINKWPPMKIEKKWINLIYEKKCSKLRTKVNYK